MFAGMTSFVAQLESAARSNHDPLAGLGRHPGLVAAARANPGFGLYVHWPFCKAKCPYCDFNSHVTVAVDHERWGRALLRELDHFAAETAGRRLTSIFFGGGTPSLMAPATVAALIERAAAHFCVEPDLEITLEANPTSAEARRLADFRAAGVNRLSLGVQALDDQALRSLGREHSAAEALAAVDSAAELVPRFSFDLIYARPGQTPAAWEAELEQALGHAGGHLSVYQLTIEPGTAFHALHARGALEMPPDDLQGAMYELTRDRLTAAGLPAYEISNHARPGEACRHNLVYWRCGDYLGIGPGAVGRITVGGVCRALTQVAPAATWLRAVARGSETRCEVLSRDQRRIELMLTGLRLRAGIDRSWFEPLMGRLEASLDGGRLAALVADGFLVLDQRGLRLSARGWPLCDAVLARLLA
jgi:oxygen-independent coproporphyrinogen-3 oxidase